MVGGEGGPGPAHMRGCVCVRAPWRAKTQGVASHHLQGTPSEVFLDWADSTDGTLGRSLCLPMGQYEGWGGRTWSGWAPAGSMAGRQGGGLAWWVEE